MEERLLLLSSMTLWWRRSSSIFNDDIYLVFNDNDDLFQGGFAGIWVIPRVWGSNTSRNAWRQIVSISKGKESLMNVVELRRSLS